MITGVILTHNEENNILDCIEALRPHVGQIILVDTESSDRTVELARQHVHAVISQPHVPNFDAARNAAIPHAHYDWIWFVDADERIPVQTGRWVSEFVRRHGDDAEAVMIPFKTYFCGKWIQHCGWWPGYTMPRLLKRGHFEFSKTLHGGVIVNGRQVQAPPDPELAIDHFSYSSIEHYIEKLNRYTSTEAQQFVDRGIKFDWRNAVRHMTADLWNYYEANQGNLDGEHGWILSWLSGQYRWLSHAKLLDLRPSGNEANSEPSIPQNLDEVLDVMRGQIAMLRAQRPILPLGIIWRSPVWDPSGYADDSRTFLKALSRGSRPLSVEDIRWSSQECVLPEVDAALLKALGRSVRPRYCAAITNCIPTTCSPDPLASLNILRTMFETDRIPDNWLRHLSQYDEVWVPSHHGRLAFRRTGVAPETLRVVPGCVDTEQFRPDGPQITLPPALNGKFTFLSVFDWAYRKGWDLLLQAYCTEFTPNDGAGLLLKITRSHLHPISMIVQQANELLATLGQSLAVRPDIVLSDAILPCEQMSALYRSVQAFVLPSRGEGWGRPYIEAMASGLPTIGTRATGNVEFMDDTNSFLIGCEEVAVPEAAYREITVYQGHRWQEPRLNEVGSALRRVFSDPLERKTRALKAVTDIQTRFGLAAGRQKIESALADAERRFALAETPSCRPDQVRVELEGELFAHHSFSKVNEQLALMLIQDDRVALSLRRIANNPTFDRDISYAKNLLPYVGRTLDGTPEVVIRHTYPPNWSPPPNGKWVHIQPWEFGKLPIDWLEPLQTRVDEVWVPSRYVRRVYLDSGIPENKLHVIPWGVDPDVYSPDVPSRLLPTDPQFAFLFVGGTIARKGFDLVLRAYLEEFDTEDDVCLVVKDSGTTSFYRDSSQQAQIKSAMADPRSPRIIYFDTEMTEGQLASLYRGCHCLVAPYRGEGFGLPILEAMACGLPAIVPRGGASDDFVSDETGFIIDAEFVEEEVRPDLCGPPSHLEVPIGVLRSAMRRVFANIDNTRQVGKRASESVRQQFTWENTARLASERLMILSRRHTFNGRRDSKSTGNQASVSACLGSVS
jgi:glycosyltransferase involved in cell wall biosynthesis